MRGAAGVPAHDCSFKIPTVWPAERLRVGCRKRIPELATLGILVTLWVTPTTTGCQTIFSKLVSGSHLD